VIFHDVKLYSLCVMHNNHTQGKTVPYARGVKDIQTGEETTTTTGLCAENSMQTSRPLQYKKSKERDNEIYRLDKWTTPLAEVYKRILQKCNDFQI
jgi:hypothetical protein